MEDIWNCRKTALEKALVAVQSIPRTCRGGLQFLGSVLVAEPGASRTKRSNPRLVQMLKDKWKPLQRKAVKISTCNKDH